MERSREKNTKQREKRKAEKEKEGQTDKNWDKGQPNGRNWPDYQRNSGTF